MPAPRYLRVAVPSPLHGYLDYLPPADSDLAALQPGMRVRVPFGKREVVGVLLETAAHTDVPAAKLKRARRVLDETPLISGDMLALARWTAEYYRHPLGEVLHALLPATLRQGKAPHTTGAWRWRLTTAGREIHKDALARAPRQRALWQLLMAHPEGLDAAALETQLPDGRAPLRALAKRGAVERIAFLESPPPVPANPRGNSTTLNTTQQSAASEIRAVLGSFRAFLLDGVTGSGKTEVYLDIIAAVLARGEQALVLVPEISLTPQLLARFRARCGEVTAFHSGLSDGERLSAWLAARDGRARVIVGTRSAVFLPLKNPGILVVDEEHDTSFKQQDGLRYSARDLAVVRAQRHGVPVLLGSATPSLESLANVAGRRYTRLVLPERAGGARHPSMRLLDIRARPMLEGLSDLLLAAVRRHLDADGQVLLFINRRGYAPTFMCHLCGEVAECRRCDSHLTLHANRRLLCHHCGAESPMPARCGHCGGADFGAFGAGTERIETALAESFPGTGIARLDRDSTRRRGSLEKLLEEVRAGTRRLLVGTQMLAKGHDFPNVTLVGVVDADQGLFGADFRAGERLAQLIVQVAGRAGRAERPGEVLIQTHHPDHPLLTHLVSEGYASFAAAALDERRALGLPPYAALALLRAEAPAADAPREFLEDAKTRLAPACGRQVALLGPVPAPMERRAGRYRWQLLLQASRRQALQTALAAALPELAALKAARRVRWSLDVDPVEML